MLMLAAALLGIAGPVSMKDWKEIVPAGAPFRIDVPGGLTPEPDSDTGSGTVTHSWKTNTGGLSVIVSLADHNGTPALTVHDFMNTLGHRITDPRKNPTLSVSDLTVLGYPATKIVFEYDLDSGIRYHGEELTFRVGQDDWSIYTGRDPAGSWQANAEAHIFASIQAPLAAPALTPATAGRLSYKAPGKPSISTQTLEGDWATYFDSWTVQAYDDQKGSTVWISHLQVKPGQSVDANAIAEYFDESIKGQSQNKPNMYAAPTEIAGKPGYLSRATAQYTSGYQNAQVMAVGDGQDIWAMLAGGPNTARTEMLFNDIVASMKIAP